MVKVPSSFPSHSVTWAPVFSRFAGEDCNYSNFFCCWPIMNLSKVNSEIWSHRY
jgi:hypothetical protein